MKNIRVVELFAGVGGFRLGLESCSPRFQTIWANQWEPGKKAQHAYDCYTLHFGLSSNHVNEDINSVKQQVPKHDLLCGGFPCQDYSVARTGAKGMEGKKGVLWWQINDIIRDKRPPYVLLENVDRLLKSHANQRGRDFGVILRCLNDLGYAVEWRVINAAEYGYAQRRRRIFIFAYKKGTSLYKQLHLSINHYEDESYFDWISKAGFFASQFPVEYRHSDKFKSTLTSVGEDIYEDLASVSSHFKAALYNSGVMLEGKVYTEELSPIKMAPMVLRDILSDRPVDSKYFLNGSLAKWEYLKGAKRIPRIRPNGQPYFFSEGGMCFPDNLDYPSRTMLTSESSVNRSTHVVADCVTGRLRLLTPVECERLNGFPDNWTNTGMPEKFRYFTMGNALVVPLVTQIAERILKII